MNPLMIQRIYDLEVIELTLSLDTDKETKKDNAYTFVKEHVKTLNGNIEQVISTINKLTNEVMTQKDFELQYTVSMFKYTRTTSRLFFKETPQRHEKVS